MEKSWRDNIRKVVPYVPGEQPKEKKIIKLNTNENPYPPSPMVQEKLRQISIDRLKYYPDPTAGKLVNVIANHFHVRADEVFVGVGSDDVLAIAFMTFFNSSDHILFADVTYSFYHVWAELFRIPYKLIPLNEELQIEPKTYMEKNGGIIIANPNAPTGSALSISHIRDIVNANRNVIVIVDEAYIDFGGTSALELISQFDNLLVVQTYSKSRSMAGMRIGFCLGNRELIQAMNNVKFSFNSYTMNETAIEFGVAAMNDSTYYEQCIGKIIATRERVQNQLKQMGFIFQPSQTNFVFVTHASVEAAVLFEALKSQGIYVRYFKQPRIDNYLRITIGTDEEMDVLLSFLEQYLSRNSDIVKSEDTHE